MVDTLSAPVVRLLECVIRASEKSFLEIFIVDRRYENCFILTTINKLLVITWQSYLYK